jgi:hypothetical protein
MGCMSFEYGSAEYEFLRLPEWCAMKMEQAVVGQELAEANG